MTFLDLYREKYERRGGTAERFVEAYRQADPEAVVDYLLEHNVEGVRGALIAAAILVPRCPQTATVFAPVACHLHAFVVAIDRPIHVVVLNPRKRLGQFWRRDLISWVK